MKKLLLLAILALGIFAGSQAKAATYDLNEGAVDQLFNNAIETVDMSATMSNSNSAVVAEDKDAMIAIALDFFLGGFGIHRFYLGTETLTWILYPITAGGFFGIVPLIDLVVLIINNENISQFINNPDFFMWKDSF